MTEENLIARLRAAIDASAEDPAMAEAHRQIVKLAADALHFAEHRPRNLNDHGRADAIAAKMRAVVEALAKGYGMEGF